MGPLGGEFSFSCKKCETFPRVLYFRNSHHQPSEAVKGLNLMGQKHTNSFFLNWSILALQCYVSLLCNKVNQLDVHICPLPLAPAFHTPHNPTPLGLHRAPGWAPCIYSQFPLASYFTQDHVYINFPGAASGKKSFCQCIGRIDGKDRCWSSNT